jgi:hypothetical protein
MIQSTQLELSIYNASFPVEVGANTAQGREIWPEKRGIIWAHN